MNSLKLTYISLLALMTAGCTSNNEDQAPEPPFVVCPATPVPDGEISDLTRSSVDNINSFALELFRNVAAASQGNVCISPTSVSAVLSMLANGDSGETRNEVLSLLRFEGSEDGLADLNFYNKTMLSHLPYIDPATTYSFTNTYWHEDRIQVREDFADRIADAMFAYVVDHTPGGPEGKEAVNKFVEENTNGLIKDFIKEPLNISSALINTTYFNGKWTSPFEPDNTYQEDFLNLDGSVSRTEFMHRYDAEYAETDDGTKAVRLPYGNGSFYLTAILPSDQINHVPLLECLDNDNLTKLADSFKPEEIYLSIPKFQCEGNENILDILKSMGLEKACDTDYGFDSIQMYSNTVLVVFLHAVKLKLDEDGTEAAAASMAGMDDYAGPEMPEKEISFNRPFVYMIQEKISGSILFMGAVTDFSQQD